MSDAILPATLTPEARERQTWPTRRIPDWALALGAYCKLCGGTTLHWSDCPEFIAVQKVMRASGPRASSLRAFYLWLLAAFVAGAIAGAALTALLSTSSRGDNSGQTSEFEGSAVRAGRMVEAAHRARTERSTPVRPAAGSEPSSTDPARTTAIDELPASAPSASPRSMVAPLRDDPALVLAAIDAAAEEFGHEAERMRIVAFCESRWDPRAVGDNGTSFGAWQFQMPTWRANVRRAGFGYSDADVFDPVASSRVAAWMWANGGELLWTCAR